MRNVGFLPLESGLSLDRLIMNFIQYNAQLFSQSDVAFARLAEVGKFDHNFQQIIHSFDVVANHLSKARAEIFILVPIAEQLRESFDGHHRVFELVSELVNDCIQFDGFRSSVDRPVCRGRGVIDPEPRLAELDLSWCLWHKFGKIRDLRIGAEIEYEIVSLNA